MKSIPGFRYHTPCSCIRNVENARVLHCLDIMIRIVYAHGWRFIFCYCALVLGTLALDLLTLILSRLVFL